MTTLNTIIEEEKKAITHKYDLRYFDGSTYAVSEEFEKDFTTAMQRAYEAGQAERDTYWKERVREIIKMADALELECGKDGDKGTKQWMAFKGFRNTIRDRFLTNEDNLK